MDTGSCLRVTGAEDAGVVLEDLLDVLLMVPVVVWTATAPNAPLFVIVRLEVVGSIEDETDGGTALTANTLVALTGAFNAVDTPARRPVIKLTSSVSTSVSRRSREISRRISNP